ncbi:hypothetical protein ACLOJK_019402 [Asimina triloba]
MADAVVSILLEKLVTFLIDEGRQLLEFEDRFDEIRNEFQYLQNYITDVERVKRRDRTETLKLIMTDVRALIYDAEEIIADYQLLSQKKKQGWASSSLFTALSKPGYDLGRKLKDVNKRIKEVKQNMISYLATVPVHGRNEVGEDVPLTYPILMTEDRIVGFEATRSRFCSNGLSVASAMATVPNAISSRPHLYNSVVGVAGCTSTVACQPELEPNSSPRPLETGTPIRLSNPEASKAATTPA